MKSYLLSLFVAFSSYYYYYEQVEVPELRILAGWLLTILIMQMVVFNPSRIGFFDSVPLNLVNIYSNKLSRNLIFDEYKVSSSLLLCLWKRDSPGSCSY